ncbi:homeobox protein BEL1 homolog [Mangifera indica]|uniref:homeobox protein BEL1 homolog n=1 Tax=Mangifera indica TaxID=29780 RepID=UPI001CFC2B16|nr:homeobox protein BEL1 homolog [Mangifera indica]
MAREICEDKSKNFISSASGFCYSDVSSSNPTVHQTHLVNQIQDFESNPEIFNLTTGMEMIGFSKNLQQQHCDSNSVMWKEFFSKHGNNAGPSSSKTINESTIDFYHHHEFNKPEFTTGISETSSENLIVGAQEHGGWQENRLLVDDSSLRCVFPCEPNERPSQGLSLSLSSSNPSSIGLQSFELWPANHASHDQQDELRFVGLSSRDGFFGKSATIQTQQQMMQDGFLGKAANIHPQGQFQPRNSRYLAPVQELLNEFCSLGTKQTDGPKQKIHKTKQRDDENASSSSRRQSIYSLDFIELQKRKTKLLSMLEEVDRRYKHYCDQMKAVVSSFEAVAGNGAATVYSALASKAMSKHFRCLRDGIVGQIQATKKAMGEKDPVAPGTTRGETPRLRILDQTLRQQKAFQQMSMMESHPWRPQRGLPERSVSVLRAWLFEHFLHPYPSDVDKHILARQTGLSRSQVSNWFINARVRLWKPMVEEMYLEETKEGDNLASPDGVTDFDDNGGRLNQNPKTDQKPTADQLVRIDSECLSSIINNNPDKNDPKTPKTLHQNQHLQHQQQNFGTFGAMELDFSTYNQHAVGEVSYVNDHSNDNQNFNGGGGVSLTLGLQQHGHGGGGVSLAFSPASQSSLFYTRDVDIENCQPVQYSLLDGEGQNLPYRNLMGAQLLHDLAG